MQACMYVYFMYVYIYTYDIYLYIYIFLSLSLSVSLCLHTHTHTYIYICMYAPICTSAQEESDRYASISLSLALYLQGEMYAHIHSWKTCVHMYTCICIRVLFQEYTCTYVYSRTRPPTRGTSLAIPETLNPKTLNPKPQSGPSRLVRFGLATLAAECRARRRPGDSRVVSLVL